MFPDIAKLCVESLRAYAREELGFKLKAAHAHEIVAAFLGYKSRIALLSDTAHPLSNLPTADYVILDSSTSLVDQRLQSLEGLPPNLPPSLTLMEKVYPVILGQKWILEKTWPSLRELAKYLAEDKLSKRMKVLGIQPGAINWEFDAILEPSPSGALANVSVNHRTSEEDLQRISSYIIQLPRIAANLGYGKPQIEETQYSGAFRKIPASSGQSI